MPVEIVRKLGLMPAAITDSYTVGTPSDLQKSKGRGFATHTVLTSATTAGTTDVLSVENGFICKTSDVLIVESDAGSEEVTVHATTAPTATSITLAAAVTLSHTTTNSKVYVKEGRVVADHDGTSYSSGSLLMLPAVDVYQSSKANLCTVTESSTAGTADLKTFYRSGSTSTIDTVETLAECHLSTQADFDTGTKNNVVSGTDYIEPAFLMESGVISAYHFNNDLVDIHNAYNGTWYGSSTTRYVTGKLNEAARFVGSNSDYISLPDNVSADLGGASVAIFEGWIKRDETGSQVAIIDLTISSTSSKFYIDLYATGEVRVGGRATSGDAFQSCVSSVCTNDTNWHYLVAKLDLANAAITIWVDDVQVGSATGLNFGATTFSSSVGVGCRLGATVGDVRFLTGQLDELILYREDKTTAYFSERYNSGNGKEITKGYATSAVYTTRSFDLNTTVQAAHTPDLIVAIGDVGSNCGLTCKVRQDSVTPLTTAYSSATLVTGGTVGNNQVVVWQASGMTDMRYVQVEITGTAPGNDTDKWQIRDIFIIPRPVNWSSLKTSVADADVNQFLQTLVLGSSDGSNTWELSQIKYDLNYYHVEFSKAGLLSRLMCVRKIEVTGGTVHSIGYASDNSPYDKTKFSTLNTGASVYEAATYIVASHVKANYTTSAPTDLDVYGKNPITEYYKWLKAIDPDEEVAKVGTGENLKYSETISELNDIAGDGVPTPSASPWLQRWFHNITTGDFQDVKLTCAGSGASNLQASTVLDFSSYVTFADDGSVTLDIGTIAAGEKKCIYFRVDAPAGEQGTQLVNYDFQFYAA